MRGSRKLVAAAARAPPDPWNRADEKHLATLGPRRRRTVRSQLGDRASQPAAASANAFRWFHESGRALRQGQEQAPGGGVKSDDVVVNL
jgi:hypothetical protein